MSERRSVTREELAAAIHEYGGACRSHYGRRTCSAEDHRIMAVAIFDALPATSPASETVDAARAAVIDAGRTWPCIWCGVSLIECGYDRPCCELNDHPFATTREAIAAIRAEADERVAALRERVESLRYSEPLLHHTPEHKMWERNEETIAYLRAALDAAPEGRR